jgi:hypothetical protein
MNQSISFKNCDLIQELDSKQRKIRSLRGFFLYALEIIQIGENYEILKTNLQPFFWRKVKTIIRQNQKPALLEFLFGKAELNQDPILGLIPQLQDQIKALNNQVDSLQQKIIQLESKLENPKDALRDTLHASDEIKTIQQGDSTLKPNMGSYLLENDTQINSQVQDPGNAISTSASEASRRSVMTSQPIKQYNVPFNQQKGLHGSNVTTSEATNSVWRSPGKIPEQERIEIIQTGFQLQNEGKISLKRYYEGTETNSLFQLKSYSVKYESIRRTKLYQQFQSSNN